MRDIIKPIPFGTLLEEVPLGFIQIPKPCQTEDVNRLAEDFKRNPNSCWLIVDRNLKIVYPADKCVYWAAVKLGFKRINVLVVRRDPD
jgi:hypothetical protein